MDWRRVAGTPVTGTFSITAPAGSGATIASFGQYYIGDDAITPGVFNRSTGALTFPSVTATGSPSNPSAYIIFKGLTNDLVSSITITYTGASTGDAISVVLGGVRACSKDTDGDGIPNTKDLDSDNDGIPDAIEASGNTTFALDGNCRVPYNAATDPVVNGCSTGQPSTVFATPLNTDGDDTPNYLELDSDNDGCPDATEAKITGTVNTTTFGAQEATPDGLTDAGCAAPANTNWTNAAVNGCTPVLKPDVNATWVGKAVTGSIAHNDELPAGGSYGAATAASGVTNPSADLPTMNADGTYSFTPSAAGVYKFEVPVCASGQTSGCSTETLTISVQDINSTTNVPVANVDVATTTSGTPVTVCALCNDTKGAGTSPLDPATVTLSGGGTTANGGTVTVDGSGNITYTPSATFTGIDTYEYTVCNTNGECATATQQITVEPAGTNTTSAGDDYGHVSMDMPTSGNVLNNDVDVDNDSRTVSFASTTQPGGSIVVDPATGAFTFTPTTGFTGTASFPYTATDSEGNTADATLYITVYPSSVALPVEFGSVLAWIKDGALFVNWETLKETNVDHFEIEVSIDGKTFKKVSTVISKANNGNSDISIQYEQSLPLSGMTVMGVSLLLLSMGMMFRRNKWLGSVLLIISMGAILYGCTKNDNNISSATGKVYVRVKQVDKDGTATYSKVVIADVR